MNDSKPLAVQRLVLLVYGILAYRCWFFCLAVRRSALSESPDFIDKFWERLWQDREFLKKTLLVLLVWILSVGLGVVGFVLFFLGAFFWTPLELPWEFFAYGAGLGGGVLLLLLGAAVTVKLLITKSLPIKVAVLTPVPVGAALVFGFCSMFVINGAFDFQGTQEYETVVVRKMVGTTKSSTSALEVRDFRPGRSGKLINVQPSVWSDGSAYRGANKGDRVIVEAGKGVFGWWYRDIRLVEQIPRTPPAPTPQEL